MSATSSLSNMIYHKELKWINNYRSQKLFLKPHKSMNFYSGIFFFSISHLKDKSKLKYLSSKIKEKKKNHFIQENQYCSNYKDDNKHILHSNLN